MFDEWEVVLNEAHVVALSAAAEISFAVDKVRNSANQQNRERVPYVRDFDVYRIQTMPEYGGHRSSFIFPHLSAIVKIFKVARLKLV